MYSLWLVDHLLGTNLDLKLGHNFLDAGLEDQWLTGTRVLVGSMPTSSAQTHQPEVSHGVVFAKSVLHTDLHIRSHNRPCKNLLGEFGKQWGIFLLHPEPVVLGFWLLGM